jgi:hypothetical protein
MSENSSSPAPQGISFATLLTLVFITLKLCGVIDWSWVWVLSPLWISLCLVVVLFVIVALGVLSVSGNLNDPWDNKKNKH